VSEVVFLMAAIGNRGCGLTDDSSA